MEIVAGLSVPTHHIDAQRVQAVVGFVPTNHVAVAVFFLGHRNVARRPDLREVANRVSVLGRSLQKIFG